MTVEVKVVADSTTTNGQRLTTMQVRYPRSIHPEVMTHRRFSRNASSSRAIPVEKIIQSVIDDPYIPIYWGKNKPGMQATEEMSPAEIEEARAVWLEARDAAVAQARHLAALGLHKQEVNRILEPFAHIAVIISATAWDNFYALRTAPDAHPVIRVLAEEMLKAHNASTPVFRTEGQWHLPYVTDEERELYREDVLMKLSVARCARVSYLNHDGTAPDVQKDIVLHDRLLPVRHMSSFEHQARATKYANFVGNFCGWEQYRKMIPDEERRAFERLLRK